MYRCRVADIGEDSIKEQKSKLRSELQAKLQDKFSAEVGLAVGRWTAELVASEKMGMQDRINDLEKRIPILSEQLVKLNSQEFLDEDLRKVLKTNISALVVDVTLSLRKPGFWEAIRRGWKQRFDFRKGNVFAVIAGAATAIGVGSQLPKVIRVPVVAIGSAIAALSWGVKGIFQSLGERRNAVKQIERIADAWTKIQGIADREVQV